MKLNDRTTRQHDTSHYNQDYYNIQSCEESSGIQEDTETYPDSFWAENTTRCSMTAGVNESIMTNKTSYLTDNTRQVPEENAPEWRRRFPRDNVCFREDDNNAVACQGRRGQTINDSSNGYRYAEVRGQTIDV